MSQYPEHDKIAALGDDRDTVQQFLDWLLEDFRPRSCDGSARLAGYPEGASDFANLRPIFETREQIMAAYFGIDLKALDQEKRAMLDAIRQVPA